MRSPRNRFLSLLLAIFWLVATQHCALEAAELFADHPAAETGAGCCSSQAHGCETDGCKAVEDGQYRSDAKVVKVAAPELMAVVFLLGFEVPPAVSDCDAALGARARWNVAPEWVPSWQFVRRAAAPAHAPDAMIA